MSNRTAEQAREYRARRKMAGNPVPRGGGGALARTAPKGATSPKAVPFVAWDGEGSYTSATATEQRYTLLQNSLGDILQDTGPDGLGTAAIFDFLVTHAPARAIHVIYGGSYDINCWLKDCDDATIRQLWETGYAEWDRYSIFYRNRKEFMVTRHTLSPTCKRVATWGDCKGCQTMQLWDTVAWFQQSFKQTVLDWVGILPDIITRGKAGRVLFTDGDMPFMQAYNMEECRLLALVMENLRALFAGAGIMPRRWDGGGAAATALMRREKVQKHVGTITGMYKDVFQQATVENVLLHAFFGARFEVIQRGVYLGAVHNYDVNSQHPYWQTKLPSFAAGYWQYTDCRDNPDVAVYGGEWTIYHIRWHAIDEKPFYPYPYRDMGGNVYFPAQGEGWVYQPELYAGLYHASGVVTEILEYWEWRPVNDTKPFAFQETLYAERQGMKAAGDNRNRAIKIAMNSCPGKTGQSIGGTYTTWENGDGTWQRITAHKPTFQNYFWYGWMLASSRAQVYAAAMQHPDDVLQFCADGIYSLAAHDLPTSPELRLGEWEHTLLAGIVICQSGVYWTGYRDTDKKAIAKHFSDKATAQHWQKRYWLPHTRGFGASEVKLADVLARWQKGQRDISYSVNRFVTMGAALRGTAGLRNYQWRQWVTVWRQLDACDTKRANPYPMRPQGLARGLYRTTPAIPAAVMVAITYGEDVPCSAAYNPKWKEAIIEDEDDAGLLLGEESI